MKLWSFIYVAPKAPFPLQSVRIAAPNSAQAIILLQALVPDRDTHADLRGRPPALLMQPAGEHETDQPGVVSVIERLGRTVTA